MKVLIADDDPVSCRILERKLSKWGYEVVVCSDGASAWEALSKVDAPNLAILDWMMPEIDGPEICRRLRENGRIPYTYILMLTAKRRKEDVIAGLDAGADDYISKPFDSHELDTRLRIGRRILDVQAGLLRSREALRIQATHDPLTGMLNRATVLEHLQKELHRARREGKSTGVIMADLDNFKQINDSFGHLTGDAVLREASRRMRRLMRNYDTIGRYGGEEFLIVIPGSDAAGAETLANRIREEIAECPISTLEGMIDLTISLGVAVGHTEDADALIGAADSALYRAKRAGKNRVTLASTSDLSRALLLAGSIPEEGAAELDVSVENEGVQLEMNRF